MAAQEVADEKQCQREGEGVDQVVGCGSKADVDYVTEHEEVGSEGEDGREEPTVVEMLLGEDGEDEDGGFFNLQEAVRACEYRGFIYGQSNPAWNGELLQLDVGRRYLTLQPCSEETC